MNKKEAYRLFWMVKGHINTSESTILASADSYFRRLWGNHEAIYHEEGFEEAWQKLMRQQMTDYLYYYDAVVRSIYDGDTMRVDIDLGFNTWINDVKLRLYGIDTPEIRGEERDAGIEVRDYVRGLLQPGTDIVVKTEKDKTGKYGRYLATIYYIDNNSGDLVNLNEHLLEKGMAEEYMK